MYNENKNVAHNYTGYGWEGAKYNETKNLNVTEIARLIRKELKTKTFDGFKFSVRTKKYSGGCSIRIEVLDVPEDFKLLNPSYDEYNHRGESRYTKNAVSFLDVVKSIGNKYRYDDSDGMIDYFSTNFYFNVDYDWELVNDRYERLNHNGRRSEGDSF